MYKSLQEYIHAKPDTRNKIAEEFSQSSNQLFIPWLD